MHILLIRFSALGDVAMLAPVVKEYATMHPDDTLTVLSKPFCAPLFNEIAPNVYFLGADPKSEYRGVRGLFRLFKKLHAMHFDLICDMHDVLRTKFLRKLFRLHGYKVRKINKHRKLRKVITAPYPKKQLRQLPTSFDNYKDVLMMDKSAAQQAATNTKGHSMIGIAPFAAHNGKIYPTDKMERVIQLITERNPKCRIYLFGGGGREYDIMQQWQQKYSQVSIAKDFLSQSLPAGEKPNLSHELKLMQQLDVMVSMDSANMHLASLVGTRVVSIWGATHPYAGFLGWGQNTDDCIQRNDLNCRPCSIYGNKPCLRNDMECMNITPEIIAEKTIGN